MAPSHWQSSHVEEKPGEGCTEGSDIAKCCALLKCPCNVKMLRQTYFILRQWSWTHTAVFQGNSKHISYLLQEGNYTSINQNKSQFWEDANYIRGTLHICTTKTHHNVPLLLHSPAGWFGGWSFPCASVELQYSSTCKGLNLVWMLLNKHN